MSRYIEYEPIMLELEKEVKLADDWKTAHEIANVVKYAPSIDIVRCGECRYWNTKDCREGVGECEWAYYMTKADDFCSYGEREGE